MSRLWQKFFDVLLYISEQGFPLDLRFSSQFIKKFNKNCLKIGGYIVYPKNLEVQN